jgi:hypothetical protein
MGTMYQVSATLNDIPDLPAACDAASRIADRFKSPSSPDIIYWWGKNGETVKFKFAHQRAAVLLKVYFAQHGVSTFPILTVSA